MPTWVTVRGSYGSPHATAGDYYAAQGSVTFLISSVVKDAAGNVVFDRIPVRAVLDAQGQFAVQLLATDDPALQPDGLTYTVTERIRGADPREPWGMEVPAAAAGTGIDLADVVPVTPGPQVFTYELASAHAADVAALQAAIDAVSGGGLTVEQVQDLVAAMTTDTSSIDFAYDDTAGTITATIKAGSVTEAMLAFTVATQAELDAEASSRAAADSALSTRVDALEATPGGVVSFQGRTGAVTLTKTDVTGTGLAAGDVGADTASQRDAAIATASTADRARANHTGTQPATTITGLATVATSGAYGDLTGRPTLGTAAAAATSDFDPAGAAATAQAAAIAASQPLDSDLTAIAALSTTTFGRALLTLADAAAGRTALGLGTAATQASSAFDAAGAAAAAQAASQPLDSDLTAIAALSTTSYGRAFLALADAAAGRTALGVSPTLTPTATKTGPYTAAVGDLAMMNVAGGGTALTLPTAPADRSQVGYRAIGATTSVPLTLTAGGSDTIGTSGATSSTVPLSDEVGVLQYQASSSRWLAVANVKSLAALDGRYTTTAYVDAAVNSPPLIRLGTGQDVIPRMLVTATNVATTAGTVRLVAFEATRSETVSSIRMVSGGTAAGATPTLVKMGLYTVGADGSVTLVASTASDTTLFSAANTTYTRSLTSPYSLVKGTRYAVGVLVVTAATAPTLYGATSRPATMGAEDMMTPWIVAGRAGETDLRSLTAAQLSSSVSAPYAAVV